MEKYFFDQDTSWFLKESDDKRLNILDRHCSTGYEHLRQRGFRDVVGWVRHRIGCESGVVGCTLELGASIVSDTKDHHLGDFYPIMLGLWIWESSWPVLGRLVGFTGIVAWTLMAVSSLYKAFR